MTGDDITANPAKTQIFIRERKSQRMSSEQSQDISLSWPNLPATSVRATSLDRVESERESEQ